MAAPYINAGTQTGLHNQLVNVQQQLRNALNDLKSLHDRMQQMIDGSDYTMLETLFGYSAGQGYSVFYQIDSVNTALTTDASQSAVATKISQFLNQIG